MVLQKITDTARGISGFGELPVTAQVSMLYDLIAEAQSHNIPLKMICNALNEAGSKCGVRYFKEALFKVRKRRTGRGIELPLEPTKPVSTVAAQKPPKSVQTDSEGNSGLTPKQQREAKAKSYMVNDNPLLNQLKDKE